MKKEQRDDRCSIYVIRQVREESALGHFKSRLYSMMSN